MHALPPKPRQLWEDEDDLFSAFRTMALSQPDSLAVLDPARKLTYGALLAEAEKHAAALPQGPADEPVALGFDQGADYLSALLGVLAAGRCFVPLDPRNPAARNRAMIEDSGARVLLTSPHHAELMRRTAGEGVEVIDDFHPRGHGDPQARSAIAFLLYTSGTTGRPKGVMQSHRQVLHNARRHIETFGMGPGDRASLLYPCSVYGGNRDIFNALLSGAALLRYPLDRLGLAPLSAWLIQQRISVMCCVATIFRQWVEALENEQFPDLRLIKIGGEAVHRAEIHAFREKSGCPAVISCGLGATEFGGARQFFIHPDTPLPDARIPCGYPVDGYDIEILGENGESLPAGASGEIAIVSDFLSPGYFRQPALTAERFDTSPDGRRRYRSGDLGMIREDGHLIHLGRRDFQVKIHGNRVELPDIEAHLAEWPSAQAAAVIADTPGDRPAELVAFVIPARPGREADALLPEMRAHLATRLPSAMLPTKLVALPSLPLLPNGKTDRLALRDMLPKHEGDGSNIFSNGNLPVDPTAKIAAIASRLLGKTVGPEDDLFALGADSLALMRLTVAIRRETGARVGFASLLGAGTARAIASLLDDPLIAGSGEIKCYPDRTRLTVIPLRRSDSGSPLFLLGTGGGSAVPYLPAARRISPPRPVYGLQIHGQRGLTKDLPPLATLAADFISEIRRLQPRGPYHFGGWSFGGFLAFEIARQLESSGESVAQLLIFDSDTEMSNGLGGIRGFLGQASTFIECLVESGGGISHAMHLMVSASLRRGWKEENGSTLAGWRRRIRERFWRKNQVDSDITDALAADPEAFDCHHTWYDALFSLPSFMRCMQAHCPGQVACDIDFFYPSARKRGDGIDAHAARWQAHCSGKVRAHLLPGTHITLFHARHAEAIAPWLAENPQT